MAGITAVRTVHESYCSDGTTRAATLQVDGPDGAFTWCGGEGDIDGIVRFLDHLRLTDHRVAARLSVRTVAPPDLTSEHRGR